MSNYLLSTLSSFGKKETKKTLNFSKFLKVCDCHANLQIKLLRSQCKDHITSKYFSTKCFGINAEKSLGG